MDFSGLTRRVGKLLSDNSPAILTAVAVTGTLTTAYLTGRASFKAAEIISDEQIRIDIGPDTEVRTLDVQEKFHLVWKLYIPAAGTAVLTVATIIAVNKIGTRRTAAMAAAYAISERAFDEYRHKVVEKIGEKKELALRDEIAQDRIDRNPVSTREVIIAGGEVLCFDSFTARYFNSSVETLRKAQNDINYQVNNDYYASLTDFYDKIGLPKTSMSDDLGWNADKLMELEFSTALSDDGRPCISISFRVDPIRNYHRIN